MIYLDYAATTPICEEALHVYQKLSMDMYGNASSLHDAGGKAKHILEYCREKIADIIGGEASGIYFTSGGTESNFLAIHSLLNGLPKSKRHFITTAMEHQSIHNCAGFLEQHGFDVTIIEPNEYGLITEEILAAHIRPETGLVSIQHANSETGIIQPIQRLSSFLHKRDILLHCDAVQTFGKIPIHTEQLGMDALSMSSHKVHGPKGVGAVYIRPGVPWKPVYPLTAHEQGFRAGTVNVPGIGAFTAAAELIVSEMDKQLSRNKTLRTYFLDQISIRSLPVNLAADTSQTECLPHIVGCLFRSFEGQYVMLECNRNNICISTGSACSAGYHGPSEAMKALRKTEQEALQFIRISFGRHTTAEQLDQLLHTFTLLWVQKKGEFDIDRRIKTHGRQQA
ncbi:IscS subfamily cysteine desulfurase [Bacillus vallismortis]|uniref:IscS subfamily cysteine desulfurase n=1 Tax=Bacillus vallismortis TaxID=72361 RepID=A0AAP3CK06_BACVA|nr:IscS subfamily cysteine desulfurase [Bacillus vallismortis]MCY8317799.1 IscS subfamily cysteine desulfurase [Bacillus vallismortis]MCY8423440.1 IscS subfamily cysteine desulfurase [Bacillus vallismortis]MEC1650777.1 IscS subfamily cysteine desulfurase [Bacillus vallismortis]